MPTRPYPVVLPVAVEALLGSGRTARARRLVADFAAGSANADAPAARTALTICTALPAQAMDRPCEAVGLFRWRTLGRPLDAARAAEARGRGLLGLHREAEARAIQDVVGVYQELGARWDVAFCRRLLRRHAIVTPHRRGRLGYGARLSPREEDVALLVVQRLANRDIAESLVLSTAPWRTTWHASC